MTNWQVKILPCAHSPSLISCSLEHSSPRSGVDYAPMAFSMSRSVVAAVSPSPVLNAAMYGEYVTELAPSARLRRWCPRTLSTQKASDLAVDGSRESCSMCMSRHGRPTPNSKTYGRKDTWAKKTRMIPPKPKAPREGRKNRMGRANSQTLQKRANDEERKGSRREESEVATAGRRGKSAPRIWDYVARHKATGWYFSM